MKRLFLTIVLLILIMCCLSLSSVYAVGNTVGNSVWNTAGNTVGVDVVLVMDCSGSMRRNDPDKLVLHGATMVAEMIQEDGWRYGAVMFEGHVTGSLPLRKVEDEEAVEAIREELEAIYHQNGRWTDLPRGLYQAIQIFLESGDIGNTRVIIALTDGEDDPESGRNKDDVKRDRNIVIALAREMDIPIYVIGLNVNGRVPQDMNELISNETSANAYEIATADQIEPTLTEILDLFRNRTIIPEPTPTPTPSPTPTPTPTPTPMPTVILEQPPDPPPRSLLRGLNLFIAAVLLGVLVLVFIIIRRSTKSGKTYISSYRLVRLFKRLFAFLRNRRPYLDKAVGSFIIEVKTLPYWLRFPGAAVLYLEHVKQKRSLQQILTYNWEFTKAYVDAFHDIKWFLTGTEFYTKQKDKLGITVPVNPRFIVQIDDRTQEEQYRGTLSKDHELKITLYQNEDNVYEIVLRALADRNSATS